MTLDDEIPDESVLAGLAGVVFHDLCFAGFDPYKVELAAVVSGWRLLAVLDDRCVGVCWTGHPDPHGRAAGEMFAAVWSADADWLIRPLLDQPPIDVGDIDPDIIWYTATGTAGELVVTDHVHGARLYHPSMLVLADQLDWELPPATPTRHTHTSLTAAELARYLLDATTNTSLTLARLRGDVARMLGYNDAD